MYPPPQLRQAGAPPSDTLPIGHWAQTLEFVPPTPVPYVPALQMPPHLFAPSAFE
jgi:hypothetical protein